MWGISSKAKAYQRRQQRRKALCVQAGLEWPLRLVFVTGAGISAASGIPTFRGPNGLWTQAELQRFSHSSILKTDLADFLAFHSARRQHILASEPTLAHRLIAALQAKAQVSVITQNIDDLHERGGSHQVLHMHGELFKARCMASGRVMDWRTDLSPESQCNCCKPSSVMRPHIVWFGEMPLGMEHIYDALEKAELFVSIGTSGNVYPAAGFVAEARRHGAVTLELNLEPSAQQGLFAAGSYGLATKIVPDWVDLMLQSDDWLHDLGGLVSGDY